MTALEFRHAKGWGRIPMPDGSESLSCDLCRATGRQYPRAGTKLIFCLGRPFMRVCLKCAPQVEKTWTGALTNTRSSEPLVREGTAA